MYWAWERQDIHTNIWVGEPEVGKKKFPYLVDGRNTI